MRKVWLRLGTLAFWIAWPVLYVYLSFGTRTRVLIVCKNQILVTKGWLSSGKWSLPGGGLHYREKPETGALREVLEETGLELNSAQLKIIAQGKNPKNGLWFNYFAFLAELDHQTFVQPKGPEIVECKWIDIKELTSKNATKDFLYILANWQD